MRQGVLRPALAALVLYLILVQPNHPGAMTWGALAVFPLELPVILFGLMALGDTRVSMLLRGLLVGALVLVAVLKIADFALFTTFGRGFNPVADMALAEAGLRLAVGAVGPALTMAGCVAALLALLALALALWWATGIWARLDPARGKTRLAAGAALVCAALAIGEIGQAMGRWSSPVALPGAAFTARVAVERVVMARETLADLRAFAEAAARDPFAGREALLARLDRDVLVIFVESYGRASFDTPQHAETHLATLRAGEARLAGLGLAMRSGWLRAPTRGGQSWLSHATFANGLWISDQTSYGAALASGRKTLYHHAAGAGFRSAAVMPQITLDWPESATMGFDTILAARDLGYRGRPFNWVTMPDQFTLAALDRLLRSDPARDPLFAQVVLSSSHAPWVPVPELVAWEEIGDGRVFDAMAEAGDPPEVVWRDRDRVRDQYRQALDYTLRTVLDYIARNAADPPLIFVVGDHQAAGFVALDERDHVPVHLVGPEDLVQAAAGWGWTPGLVPAAGSPPRGMDEMRDLILDAFSPPGAEGGDS